MRKEKLLGLADCSWNSRGQDIIITGAIGMGKSIVLTSNGWTRPGIIYNAA
ncbi:MAG: hypothetical protein U5P10_14855 [Spirochaetia bacterium]|nr:hypothetical protein [Spirochaetia bacterium]